MAGRLGWTPDTFWKATYPELYFMHRGWMIGQGVDPDKLEQKQSFMSKVRIDELEAQFPDRGSIKKDKPQN